MKSSPSQLFLFAVTAAVTCAVARPATAQIFASDDAAAYYKTPNWTNSANQGFGFTP
jgi:hypothetical protein